MTKEMEEATEKKQAPKYIGRRLAAAITAAAELFVPATAALADGVPTPDKPTSVTGPAVPGKDQAQLAKETIKKETQEVKYETVLTTKDIFSFWPERKIEPDGSVKFLKDSSMPSGTLMYKDQYQRGPLIEINGDFKIQFGMTINTVNKPKEKHRGDIYLWGGAEKKPEWVIVLGILGDQLYMGFGSRGKGILFVKEGTPTPQGGNLKISFENVNGDAPEIVTVYDDNTEQVLGRVQLPKDIFPGKFHIEEVDITGGGEGKDVELIISHFNISTPANSQSLVLAKKTAE